MIIKLPICNDDKIIFSNFVLERIGSKYNLSLFNRNYEKKIEKIKVPLCNNFEGITYLDLFLPLEMNIINNKIIFNNFMQKIYLSQNNLPIDFFFKIEEHLKKDKVTFLTVNDFKEFDNNLWKYLSEYNDEILPTNHTEMIKKLWDVAQIYLNFSMYLINQNPDFTNKTIKDYQKKFNISKKIISIANYIKTIKVSINSSNEYIFNEHYNRLNNIKPKITELKIGFKYFVKSINSNKFFQIDIANIQDNIIHASNNQVYIYPNYEWYFYLPNLQFDFESIIFNLLINKNVFIEIFEKTNLKIEEIHTRKLLEYFTANKECSLIYLRKYFTEEFSDLNILQKNNYSNIFFKYICEKYTDNESIINIYKILFSNYSYPIKQNKLDTNFDHIIYFSLLNINKIVKEISFDKVFIENSINEIIPFKARTLFYNIIQLFYSITVKNTYHVLYFNQKFFNDYLHRCVFKNIILNEKSLINELFNSYLTQIQKEKIYNIIKNTLLCIDVSNRLTWNNLPKKLSYLEIFYSNKEIIINGEKLNKNIFNDNYDPRLKKVIEYPFDMFRFLKKEKDFVKWLKFIGPLSLELFYTPISLSTEDIEHLGKIIYLLINIKEQNVKDESYVNFLNYSQKYSKLVLDNTRINLKIKEHFNFIKCNVNLGFLAKHLTYNKNDSINLEEELEKTQDLVKLEEDLHKMTKKYYKYKTKYLKSKYPSKTEYPFSATSEMIKKK